MRGVVHGVSVRVLYMWISEGGVWDVVGVVWWNLWDKVRA